MRSVYENRYRPHRPGDPGILYFIHWSSFCNIFKPRICCSVYLHKTPKYNDYFKENFKVFDVLDFIAAVTAHILYQRSKNALYFITGNQEVINATVGISVDTLVNPGISF